MSTRILIVLFRPSQFELSWLEGLLATAKPLDRAECFEHARLRPNLHAALYTPPLRKSFTERWDYGLEYFDETLSGELIALSPDRPWEVLLFAIDESRLCTFAWRIGSTGDERRFVTDKGVGVVERVDAQGNQETESGSICVPENVAEEDVDAAQAALEAPFAAEPVLKAMFGVSFPALLTLVVNAPWERFWPAAKKPAAKKPAAKKPAAKKPAAKKPAAKKPAARKPAAKKPAAKKPAAKKPKLSSGR